MIKFQDGEKILDLKPRTDEDQCVLLRRLWGREGKIKGPLTGECSVTLHLETMGRNHTDTGMKTRRMFNPTTKKKSRSTSQSGPYVNVYVQELRTIAFIPCMKPGASPIFLSGVIIRVAARRRLDMVFPDWVRWISLDVRREWLWFVPLPVGSGTLKVGRR